MLECPEEKKNTAINGSCLEDKYSLTATDGTVVSILREEGRETISLRSEKGQLIVEYHPETKKCHLHVPEGDLHLDAPTGSISIASGRDIKLQCPGNIVIEGKNNVKLYSGNRSPANASLILGQNQAKISGTKVAINAEQGDFSIIKSRVRSRRLAARIDRARVSLDNFEILAETMRQKNKTLHQSVENLFQINAGKMRTFVRGLFNLKGRRTYLKADKDMKLKGEKIHLR